MAGCDRFFTLIHSHFRAPVAPLLMLGHDTFKPHPAGHCEQLGPYLAALKRCDENALRSTA